MSPLAASAVINDRARRNCVACHAPQIRMPGTYFPRSRFAWRLLPSASRHRGDEFHHGTAVRIRSGPQHGCDWLGACRVKKNDTARAPAGGNGRQRRGAADGRAMTAELTDGTVGRLLIRLDRMLRAAVERMLPNLGPDAAADPFRGLYISRDHAARPLDRWPGGTAWSAQPSLADDLTEADRREDGSQDFGSELAWLADAYGLSDFDLHVVLLALAPEIDLRYERVYAFLQDDVSRRRPTVDLALNLVCATPEDKLRRRWHFTDEAPLIRNDVVRLVPESGSTEPPLLTNALKLDERIVSRLFGYRGLDPVLRGICAIIERADSALEVPASGDRLEALVALGRQVKVIGEPLCLYLS